MIENTKIPLFFPEEYPNVFIIFGLVKKSKELPEDEKEKLIERMKKAESYIEVLKIVKEEFLIIILR
jgi:hypothetical protein